MKLKEFGGVNYVTDEFGRIVIENKEILEYINGYGELELLTSFSNKACGSNGACGNTGCENLGC